MSVRSATNRGRIVSVVLLSVVTYALAMIVTGAAVALTVAIWVIAKAGDLPSTSKGWEYLGIGIGAVIVLGSVIGFFLATVRIPRLRRKLEARVLTETQATFGYPDEYRQLRNVIDGLAIASGIPSPRFAVITDPAPNSVSVGTRPEHTVIAVTSGLLDELTRPQLEAVVAYEITRVASLDVALSTWTAALTGAAGEALDSDTVAGLVGRPVRWSARRLQRWALRDTARERDERAIAMSKNPHALIAALEVLAADPRPVATISNVTAPLWIEVPNALVGGLSPEAAGTLRPLLLSERIAHLRELAHLAPLPEPPPTPTAQHSGAQPDPVPSAPPATPMPTLATPANPSTELPNPFGTPATTARQAPDSPLPAEGTQ